MRCTDAFAVRDEQPAVERVVDRGLIRNGKELRPRQGAAERDREHEPVYGPRQRGDPRTEDLVDDARQGQVESGVAHSALGQEPRQLEHEQWVALTRVIHEAENGARKARTEPLGDERPARAEAERPERMALDAEWLERLLQAR